MGTTQLESPTRADVERRIRQTDFTRANMTVTVCKLTLDNGFTVRAESGCSDPRLYNKIIGEKLARERAIARLINFLEFAALEDRFRSEQEEYDGHR